MQKWASSTATSSTPRFWQSHRKLGAKVRLKGRTEGRSMGSLSNLTLRHAALCSPLCPPHCESARSVPDRTATSRSRTCLMVRSRLASIGLRKAHQRALGPRRAGASQTKRGGQFMDELLAGVELKLQNPEFHLDMMGRSIQPPEQTAINVALQASGALIDTGCQRSFYAYLDAFLSAARSILEIIQCCFGADLGHPDMKQWFENELLDDERARRHEVQERVRTALQLLSCAPPQHSPQY
jgi:hypothetical protein